MEEMDDLEGLVSESLDYIPGNRENERFEPLVIIEFTADTKQAAIEWLMAHIQESKLAGGAELEVKMTIQQHSKVGYLPLFIFIHSSTLHLNCFV